ncbi:MAG: outer membrane beta-barrel protein [Bacteroidota bacterium]
MNTGDQFDNLFRDKFNNGNIDFDEEHWKLAEQLIIAKEKKERKRKMTIWFSAGAILLYGFLFWNSLNKKQDVISENKITVENIQTENRLKSDKEKLKELKGSEEINQNKSLTQSRNEQRNSDFKNSILKTNSESKETINVRAFKKKNYLAQSNINSNATAEENIGLATDNSDNDLVENKNLSIGNLIEEHSELLQSADELSISLSTEETSASDIITKDTSLENNQLISKPVLDEKKSFPQTSYSIFAGAFINKAFNNTENESGYGVNLTGGVSIIHQFNSTWSMELDAMYLEKGKLNSSKNFHSEYYMDEFGKRTEDINIRSTQLQYIIFPVLVQYHFNNNSQLMETGASYGYLINASSSIEYTTQITGSGLSLSKENKHGYVNGFEKHDIALLLGYGHHLVKNLQAGIRLHYGLKDITKNSYYNNLSIDKNMGVNIFLKYKLH